MSKRQAHWCAAILLLCVTAGGFRALVAHPGDLLVGPQRGGYNDVTDSILPVRAWPAQIAAREGSAPLWNPSGGVGLPWVGNPQSAMLYPGNWLYFLFPAEAAVSWVLFAHHLLAGIGVYFLARRLKMSYWSGVLSGCCFALAPYLLANSAEGHYNPICLMAWVPWAFIAFDRWQEGHRGSTAILAFVISLQFFAGHAQEVFYEVLLMSGLVATRAGIDTVRGQWKTAAWSLLRWTVVGISVIGLVAKDLLPIRVYTQHAIRAGGLAAEVTGLGGVPVVGLAQLFNPWAWGPADHFTLPAGVNNLMFWETFCYFGLIPLLLAVLAACSTSLSHPARRFAILAAITLLFALGSYGPIYETVHRLVPGISYFRAPSRALFLTSFCVALLAGFGLDWLQSAQKRTTRAVWGGLGLAGLSIGLIAGIGSALSTPAELTAQTAAALPTSGERSQQLPQTTAAVTPPDAKTSSETKAAANGPNSLAKSGAPVTGTATTVRKSKPVSSTGASSITTVTSISPWQAAFGRPLPWIFWSVACLGLLLAAVSPQLAHRGAMLVGLFAVVELLLVSGPLFRTIDASTLRKNSAISQFLSEHSGLHRVLVRQVLLSDREAWQDGINKLQVYEPVPVLNTVHLFAALAPDGKALDALGGFELLDIRTFHPGMLDLLGVKYLVLQLEQPLPELMGWKLVHTGEFASQFAVRGQQTVVNRFAIYENPDPLPRAYLVGQTQVLDPRQNAIQALRRLDPRQAVLVGKDSLPAGPRQAFRAAEIQKFTANRIEIQATLEHPGYLVLTDLQYPGWRARVDGKLLPVETVNLGLRGVALPAGTHAVVFEYMPVGLITGTIISGVTGLLLLPSLIWRGRRRNAQHSASTTSPEASVSTVNPLMTAAAPAALPDPLAVRPGTEAEMSATVSTSDSDLAV